MQLFHAAYLPINARLLFDFNKVSVSVLGLSCGHLSVDYLHGAFVRELLPSIRLSRLFVIVRVRPRHQHFNTVRPAYVVVHELQAC